MRMSALVPLLALSCLLPQCEPQSSPLDGPPTSAALVFALPDDPLDDDGYDPIERYEAMAIPADNPLTPEKAALGWQLYYDSRLSGDGSRSCYSCHVCEKGLTDGLPVAIGAFDKQLTRSSPTMWNVGYHENLYWDGRAGSLEAQAAAAWKGANMGASDPEAIVAALNALPGYREQFEAVFGEPATVDNVPAALATYMRTIVSDDTPWDRWQKGDEAAVDEAAKRGWQKFQDFGCTGCHAGVLLTDQQFHNVGIGMDKDTPDLGRHAVTQADRDRGAFKTPTLRDITQSAPYFHDGSVATLEEAVRFMLGGGLDNPWLSRDKLKAQQYTDEDVADLLAFLESLDQPCDLVAPELP